MLNAPTPAPPHLMMSPPHGIPSSAALNVGANRLISPHPVGSQPVDDDPANSNPYKRSRMDGAMPTFHHLPLANSSSPPFRGMMPQLSTPLFPAIMSHGQGYGMPMSIDQFQMMQPHLNQQLGLSNNTPSSPLPRTSNGTHPLPRSIPPFPPHLSNSQKTLQFSNISGGMISANGSGISSVNSSDSNSPSSSASNDVRFRGSRNGQNNHNGNNASSGNSDGYGQNSNHVIQHRNGYVHNDNYNSNYLSNQNNSNRNDSSSSGNSNNANHNSHPNNTNHPSSPALSPFVSLPNNVIPPRYTPMQLPPHYYRMTAANGGENSGSSTGGVSVSNGNVSE